jgi:hypothetical protein
MDESILAQDAGTKAPHNSAGLKGGINFCSKKKSKLIQALARPC